MSVALPLSSTASSESDKTTIVLSDIIVFVSPHLLLSFFKLWWTWECLRESSGRGIAILTGSARYLRTVFFTESCWVRWLENYQNGQRCLSEQLDSITFTIVLWRRCCWSSHPLGCDTLLLDAQFSTIRRSFCLHFRAQSVRNGPINQDETYDHPKRR